MFKCVYLGFCWVVGMEINVSNTARSLASRVFRPVSLPAFAVGGLNASIPGAITGFEAIL